MNNIKLPENLACHDTLMDDKDFRIGHLPNGLTYYIRHNEEPKNMCNIEILHRVGSLQEEEHERGLAHFLEHMGFNGTEHFPGYNGARLYMEKLGISASATINACTSRFYTYYYLNNVPTDKGESLLDDCLQLVADWGGAFLLDGECIERERGVVKTECMRASSNMGRRLFDSVVETITSGNKYAYRKPLGLLSVVEGFPHDAIREFYRKWYIPQNQAVFIVGDIDVDIMEQKVAALFGKYQNPEKPAPVREYPMDFNEEPIFAFATDKELPNAQIILRCKYPVPDAADIPLSQYGYCEVVKTLIEIMLEMRVADLLEMSESPFSSVQKDIDSFFESRVMETVTISCNVCRGMELDAYRNLLGLLLKIRANGFSESEFQQAIQIYQNRLEKTFAERSCIHNNTYCELSFSHFLSHEPITSVEGIYNFSNDAIQYIDLDLINTTLRDMLPDGGRNFISMVYVPEADGDTVFPDAGDFRNLAMELFASDFKESVSVDGDFSIMNQMPEPGKIVDEQYDSRVDAYTLTLSNGVKITYKVTDFSADEIKFQLKSYGGSSQFEVEDFPNFRLMDEVMTSVGLGDLSESQLRKYFADKAIRYEYSVYEHFHYLKGQVSKLDLETLMQVIYCFFCNPGHCEGDFRNFVNRRRNIIMNYKYQPTKIMEQRKDELVLENCSRDHWMTLQDVDRMDLARILEMHRQLFSDASAFDFHFVGAIDVTEFKTLVEKYLAGLPSTNKGPQARHWLVCDEYRNIMHCSQVDMVEPIAMVGVNMENRQLEYSVTNYIMCKMLQVYMDKRVGDEVRRKASISYSCWADVDLNIDFKNPGMVCVILSMAAEVQPEYGWRCRCIMNSVLDQAVSQGVSDADFSNIKEEVKNIYKPTLRRNAWWIYYIRQLHIYGLDLFSDISGFVEAVGKEDFNQFIKKVVRTGTRQTFVFTPTGVEQVSAPDQQ